MSDTGTSLTPAQHQRLQRAVARLAAATKPRDHEGGDPGSDTNVNVEAALAALERATDAAVEELQARAATLRECAACLSSLVAGAEPRTTTAVGSGGRGARAQPPGAHQPRGSSSAGHQSPGGNVEGVREELAALGAEAVELLRVIGAGPHTIDPTQRQPPSHSSHPRATLRPLMDELLGVGPHGDDADAPVPIDVIRRAVRAASVLVVVSADAWETQLDALRQQVVLAEVDAAVADAAIDHPAAEGRATRGARKSKAAPR